MNKAPKEDNAPPGKYPVKVEFIINKDGFVTNVKAVDVPAKCPSCGKDAVKMIMLNRQWIPASNGGVKVNHLMTQTITYQVVED